MGISDWGTIQKTVEKTFFGWLSYVSENVFGGVFSVMNKRGQGFASGCNLLNVFFVLYATFFFYSVGTDGSDQHYIIMSTQPWRTEEKNVE